MNAQNYTQKTVEAIQAAQSIATTYGSQQIEQCHLLLALLTAGCAALIVLDLRRGRREE